MSLKGREGMQRDKLPTTAPDSNGDGGVRTAFASDRPERPSDAFSDLPESSRSSIAAGLPCVDNEIDFSALAPVPRTPGTP